MSNGKNIKLNSFDSLFGTENPNEMTYLNISSLSSFKDHPFKVVDDEKMEDLKESIKENGILNPVIVREKNNNEYEIISGHRRVYAAGSVGIKSVPAFIKKLTDDEATILMVDCNIQREEILPSEKAFSYKMKLEALKKQGKRTDLTSSQVGTKLRADEELAEQTGESRNQIQRYIRLTYLIKELLELVDTKELPLNTAVELSYLTDEEQMIVSSAMDDLNITPSIAQVKKLREYNENGQLSNDTVAELFTASADKDNKGVSLKIDTDTKNLFPDSYSKKDMTQLVNKLIKEYFENGGI